MVQTYFEEDRRFLSFFEIKRNVPWNFLLPHSNITFSDYGLIVKFLYNLGYVAIVALCIAVLMAILITLFLQYYYHRHNSMHNKVQFFLRKTPCIWKEISLVNSDPFPLQVNIFFLKYLNHRT